MRLYRWILISMAFALALASADMVGAQEELPTAPVHNAISGAFEGWFPNQDGSFSILVGYFNRNFKQAVDVPIGPENQILPDGPDRGQPTHFLPGRQWGVFTINVPKDWGNKTLTWSLTVNGQSTSVVFSLTPVYIVAPFLDADYNTPPYVSFSENGKFVNGPVAESADGAVVTSESLTAAVGVPLPLDVWVADDAVPQPTPEAPPAGLPQRDPPVRKQPVAVAWTLFRGLSSAVQFDKARPDVAKLDRLTTPPPGTKFFGKAGTTVTFSQPGNYVLGLQVFDDSSMNGGGDQCCYTDAKVNVSVK